MDILRSSDYSNTKTYLKILHPTARGVVFKHHLKHASRKKMVGLKHKFHSWDASLGNVLTDFIVPGNLVYIKSVARPLKLRTFWLSQFHAYFWFNMVMISCVIGLCVVE